MTEIDADLRPAPGVVIRSAELTWRFTTSGGPGGQHANRSATRAEVVFDIANSPSLSDGVRSTLLQALGPVARASSSEQRSQLDNRRIAVERLEATLRDALRVRRRRVDTRPTLASKRRRLEDKRRRSESKAQRRRPGSPDG